MDWIILFIAGIFETAWAVTLKYTQGFTKPLFSVITVIFMVISFFLLSYALKTIPVGTAYAVWTGIGAFGVAIIGIIFLAEPANAIRIISLLLVVAGVAGLRLAGK
ncbi:MAG TPA: quaternary ammonium compound efflux SMR transporter SugE [Candidatus Goldiibacteriota bacterium]|mgnify:FL=1|nr:quaternary ammonium compound efflux SMR transporter SugE [Candidatus Goldiibacteriota bacterium]HPI04296.1 quaternary ammonium compound efflux SMR transporter SugE [Candidatus Goldiibacteriota bacterium]HPN65154.1 quaternary ammonium compound efflux SMR transporter SugE [Candidatus Goldiibacteriota bacterium]HRQ44185.1 quaternary ammonium compound efflux SMR transporter SugE [Candidatus Goldiibacteriota bacterium]